MIEKSANYRQQLTVLLERELNYTKALSDILQQESAALTTREVATLEAVIENKQEQLKWLAAAGREREALILSAGYPANNEGINSFILQHDSNQQLAILWQELLDLATKCHEQNRINGSVINLGHRHLQYALEVLTGQTHRSGLYDPNGQTTEYAACRSLAQA